MTDKKRPITIDDLWSMKRFGAPTLSPDGRWACVPVTSFSMTGNDSTSRLWLLATDGSAQRQLTRGKKDGDPQWSPDGKWIAFVAKRDEPPSGKRNARHAAQIHVIGIDGGEARRMTDCATGVSALRWFPDSRRIAFVSWVWPELKDAKAQARRAKEERHDKVKAFAIENNHYRYWDHWFERGRKPHIHIAELPTGIGAADGDALAEVRDLFAGTDFHLPPQEPDAALYDISPDGREIAFTFDFDPDPRSPSFTDIVVMDAKSGKSRALTRATGRSDESPRYSPDGKWIAFLSSDLAKAHNEQARLAVIARSNDAIVPLTFAWDRGIGAPPSWSADSARLYFLAETEIAQPLWKLDLADMSSASAPHELLRGPHHGGVATELRVSADGATLVYARSSQAHPQSLYACDANGDGERAIERFNAALLDKIAIAESRSVTISGADGDAVQMWVTAPPDFDAGHDPSHGKRGAKQRGKQGAGKKWPLMQVIHGGPHTCSNDAWHWRWNTQLFAAEGYVVAAVNYHGSTGWGQDSICSINGDWGRRELADVEAGTDFMLATGHIDGKRVVATGGSYGGFMVAYMNGNAKSKRYAAYVCHAGCYDWVSMMGSDGYFWFGHELGAFPWEDEARVLAQSPHHYAANFATPTLVMHGELDYRVPYYQALAYYNTLRVKKVPSRLVFFPDENHWILKPQNSRLWYREVFDWCNRYTEGARKKKDEPARNDR